MKLKDNFVKIIFPAFRETMFMLVVTAVLSIILGFILAIAIYLTDKEGLRPMPRINSLLNIIINVIRSFPFIILLVSIIPFTRLIVGTSIGIKAAIVPLTVATTPYMARLFDNSFKGVNNSLIEAGISFGLTDFQIMKNIVIKESVPSIINNITISIIGVINSSAMAGTVGAGGLGAIAIMYGYQNFNNQIMYGTVLVIIILVHIIQTTGNFIYRKIK